MAFSGFVAAALLWSGATLAADAVALARVEVQPLGGSLVSAHASGPDGRAIPFSLRDGRLTPQDKLVPGDVKALSHLWRFGYNGRDLSGPDEAFRLPLEPTDQPFDTRLLEASFLSCPPVGGIR